MPLICWPSCSDAKRASRSTLFSSSSTARLDTTTLLRRWSSLMTLNSRLEPSRWAVSRNGRMSTSDPGRNARMSLMSTVKPPLTLPFKTPLTTLLLSKASWSISQDSARRAFSRDRRVSPKPSSTVSMATFTWSPTSRPNSPASLRNWPRGMTPSDFSPAWTTTKSLSMSTMVPVTIAPGSISIVFKLCSNSAAKLSSSAAKLSSVAGGVSGRGAGVGWVASSKTISFSAMLLSC